MISILLFPLQVRLRVSRPLSDFKFNSFTCELECQKRFSFMAYQINRKVTATSKITPDSTSSCLILVLTQKSNYLLRSSPETFFYLTLTRIILIKALINACGKFSNMLIHVSLHSIQIFIAHVFAHSNVKVVKLIYYLKMLYK